MEQKLKVAYILYRFPYLSETFIMREMYWVREHGIDLCIFSLRPPKHKLIHEQARELLPYTRYSPLLSWSVIKAQIRYLWRSPVRYFRALATSIRQTYREPILFLSALAIFPESVYIAQQMEKSGIDHIHAHFVWLQSIAASIVSELLGITYTVHPHAFDLFVRNQQGVRQGLENASKVITVSTYHQAYIAELCTGIDRDNIEIVHYGLETDQFRPVTRRSADEKIRILSVGRLVPKKGHQYLIDACALLAERGLSFECQIVGDGPLREALQKRISQHQLQGKVILLGAQTQEHILELYQNSDIFALPCVLGVRGGRDGMPNVLIEAMACEVPVVTTSIAGIPDLVRDNENGLFVGEREVVQLADALECLMLDENLRRRLGKQARKTVLDAFQVEDSAAKMASIFWEVSGRCQPVPEEHRDTSPDKNDSIRQEITQRGTSL